MLRARSLSIAVTAAAGALVLSLPGSAFGAVTIGSDLDASANATFFQSNPATKAQRNLITDHRAPDGLTSPINGVVVRWRVKADDGSPPIAFRVIRPGADAEEATGAGTSATKDPQSNTTTSFGLNPGMPIRVGDGIGINTAGAGSPNDYFHGEAGVGDLNSWDPPLVDGGVPRTPEVVPSFFELLLQAVVEPDKDGDRLGDESQDPDGGNPPRPAPRPCRIQIFNLCIR
jgi:hypothetical protein